jgi:hypothetical protein
MAQLASQEARIAGVHAAIRFPVSATSVLPEEQPKLGDIVMNGKRSELKNEVVRL